MINSHKAGNKLLSKMIVIMSTWPTASWNRNIVISSIIPAMRIPREWETGKEYKQWGTREREREYRSLLLYFLVCLSFSTTSNKGLVWIITTGIVFDMMKNKVYLPGKKYKIRFKPAHLVKLCSGFEGNVSSIITCHRDLVNQ